MDLRLGQHRLGIKADRRVGTTVTGNVGNPGNPQCQMHLFQFLRHLFQTGSVTTLPQNRTRSFFATFSPHHGPQKVDWLAKTLPTFGLLNSQARDWTITVSDTCLTESFKASFS